MNPQKQKRQARIQRHKRVRARIVGSAIRPRLCIFRSNRFIELQLIDDEKGHTIAAMRVPHKQAHEGGIAVAQKAKKKRVSQAIFDRGGYAYHGRVKEAAEGAREGGLIF